MTVYLQDPDLTLYHGDVRDVLRTLPDGSVDCVITSPPYWGLRDYGTGAWAGGDEGCDHTAVRREHGDEKQATSAGTSRDRIIGEDCRRCGATRVDNQLGLEPDPATYVTNMVAVFREVRRVLADHGTCWVNLGDSYAQDTLRHRRDVSDTDWAKNYGHVDNRVGTAVGGLKAKDLVGTPWRIAFALQNDGWYLRADIIWSKPNPMPESVTDRPTKSHEYLFLLSKQPRYWFDAEAVREPAIRAGDIPGGDNSRALAEFGVKPHAPFNGTVPAGRNIRSVWEIATQSYSEAHFATFPEELVRRALLAGCPEWVCVTCGKPRERIVETRHVDGGAKWAPNSGNRAALNDVSPSSVFRTGLRPENTTLGWSDCGHGTYRPGRVLDPFGGSGTTALVARKHGRHAILVELSEAYCRLAARRLQQLSLFAEAHG